MTDKKTVVLNEADSRLEEPQTGDEVIHEMREKFNGGIHILDLVEPWTEENDDSDTPFTNKRGMMIGSNVPESMGSYYELHTGIESQGVYHLDNNNGGYVYGHSIDFSYRADLADVGFWNIDGIRSTARRIDNADIGTAAITVTAFNGVYNQDAGSTAVTERVSTLFANNKIEDGTVNKLSVVDARFLLGSSANRDVTITDTAVVNISGTLGRVGGNSTLTNFYGFRFQDLNKPGTLTQTIYRAISIEDTDAEVFMASVAVHMPNLPTTDPLVPGQLWVLNGVLRVSIAEE